MKRIFSFGAPLSSSVANNRNGFRFAVQLLCWEGAFGMAYETWIGVTYVSGLAGEIGVSVALLSVLTAIPYIGSLGQLVGIWAYERASSVRGYTVALASAARALWSVPLFSALYFGYRSYWQSAEFPKETWFKILALVACSSAILATSSSAAWMSWVRELVPPHVRGRFFGMRLKYVMGAVVLANLMGALWVSWRPGGWYLGYGVLGILALMSAATSTLLLSRVPDRPSHRPGRRSWKANVATALSDRRFRKVLIFGALFNGTIQMAGPFFPYYFTRDLGIPMSRVALWTALANLGWMAASSAWGRRIDLNKDEKKFHPLFWVAAYLIAISPAYYIFAPASLVNWIAPLDYFSNGIVWAGYTLAFTTVLMEVCPRERSAVYFAIHSAVAGLAGAIMSFAGGQIAYALSDYGGFRALWLISTIARVLVVWGLFSTLEEARRDSRSQRVPDRGPILPIPAIATATAASAFASEAPLSPTAEISKPRDSQPSV